MDEDLKKIAPILDALWQTARDPASYGKSLEEVDAEFTRCLAEAAAQPHPSDATLIGGIRAALFKVIRRPKTKEALLELIRVRCELSDRQVRLLKASGFIKLDAAGKPLLRDAGDVLLAPERAALYLFSVGLLSGMALYPIFFADEPNLELIVRSFGLGMALGSLGGFVLERSFRAYPVFEKVKGLRPWFQGELDGETAA